MGGAEAVDTAADMCGWDNAESGLVGTESWSCRVGGRFCGSRHNRFVPLHWQCDLRGSAGVEKGGKARQGYIQECSM